MEAKTHYKRLRNPNYIGSYELMTGGEPIELIVQIEKAVKEMVQNGDKKEEAMVIYLKGQKPMIVNSTNAKAITASVGSPYVEDWTGKNIKLYVARIKAFGETVDALRVRKEPVIIKLPELPIDSKTFTQSVTAIKAGNTTMEAAVKFLETKYTITENILKALQDAVS